jgi:hypothetical protein
MRRAAFGALLLAGLSLLLPSVPTTDPWGWLVWGREVAHLSLDTSVAGAPSWKPLPVLLTAPLSAAGDAAPDLWLALARAGALLALWPVFLVARRLGGHAAAAVALGALVLSDGWLRAALHGYSEPLVAGLALGAVELHLRGRRGWALGALALAGLARPEAWLFLAGYAAWCWRRDRPLRRAAAAAVVVPPALWLGGDLVGSGDALRGGQSATAISQEAGLSPGELVGQTFGGETLVLLALGVVALALGRDRLTPAIAGLGAAWGGLVTGLLALGWPASERFLLPAVAASAVLAGVGGVRLWTATRGRAPVRVAAPAAAALLAAGFLVARVERAGRLVDAAADRAELQGDLRRAVSALGRERLLACGAPVLPHDLHWNEGALAWELDLPLRKVREVKPWRAVRGRARRNAVLLSPRRPPHMRGAKLSVIGRARGWRAYLVEPRYGGSLRSSGRTAGPCTTAPSRANREPWQGQSQVRSAPFQSTMQPRWVQRADSARTVPSSSR